MYPTLLTVGRLSVPTYTLLLDLGLILALVLARAEGRRLFGSAAAALDAGLWAVVAGIVGGRVAFAAVNWPAFAGEPARLLRVWEGGLSFHGAFVAGTLAVVALAWLQGYRLVDLWRLVDALAPGLAVGIAFGWAACLAAGCACGAPGEGWGYAILPDLYGVDASRFATQAAGLVYALVLLGGVVRLRRAFSRPGTLFWLYLLFYFAGSFFLGFTRGDESIYLGPWRLGQAVDLLLVLISAVVLLLSWWRRRSGLAGG
ncbi:MAG: prolipoprotein diacylglyceryl transferase [Anaerolineae bacterium]|nr:prolipoprotein diacylglyceryl transferase [Anaerolineae bacterium]